ncbi:MAG: response regulator, partial [bacterium]|nr:response regulator [bacterium]
MEKSINCPQPEAPGDILVVDDKVESLRTIEALLKEHGYKVRCIPDAKMALEVVADKPPGLMLLDVNMPGMNGFEVCRALKACPETRTFPILFLTPQTKRENLLKGFQAGGVDYITKPFLEQEVLTRVETHLTKGKAQH